MNANPRPPVATRTRAPKSAPTAPLTAPPPPTSPAAPTPPTPPTPATPPALIARAQAWFRQRGWQPFEFQCEVWEAMGAGRSGLLHATTGSGKTYAVGLGALARAVDLKVALAGTSAPALGVLWLTPMRALAADTVRALQLPLADLAPNWTLGMRTGDTPSAERARQDRRMPSWLVTTPESLSVMLSRANAPDELAGVHTVIVDEWHELMGNKRGVQVQLALARIKHWRPGLVVWGLSATLGNVNEAMDVLLSTAAEGSEGPEGSDGRLRAPGQLVQGRVHKDLLIDTLLPDKPGRFSWGGHLGKQMQLPVIAEIEKSTTTLVFVNVRSQAEIWYQLLLAERPEWAGVVALHHGSLDRSVREWVEAALKAGQLKAVVATSSLDLGVDFLPVERVLQIGSAKGIARLLQRAGRSGHAPGRASRITLVPTNTLELVEAVAARWAAKAGTIERRAAPDKPFDVLVQHLVTVALGGGFTSAALFTELRSSHAYRNLTRDEFQWALDFVVKGGSSLTVYPEYHRVVDIEGVYRVPDRGIARRHRMQIGTIVSDSSMTVAYLSGGRIGVVEEGFISRLRKGDCFIFAGRMLEFIRTQDMTAYVRRAEKSKGVVTSWSGAKMPLSNELADAVLKVLAGAGAEQGERATQDVPAPVSTEGAARARKAVPAPTGTEGAARAKKAVPAPTGTEGAAPASSLPRINTMGEPELEAARPMLETQLRLSRLPTPATLLIERYTSREGLHLFVYPFAGRNAHIGQASLLAWRMAKDAPNTFSLSINDYGLELLSAVPVSTDPLRAGHLFSATDLLHDVLASLNSSELARRRFREIARVAGLVFTGYPGQPKSARQLQASSSLFYEVFSKYDPQNMLLTQAQTEVLSQDLDIKRLAAALERMRGQRVEFVELKVPSPFALPLLVERFREKLSTEKLQDRLERMLRDMERVAEEAEGPMAERRRSGR